jgi:predicted amidophosphoribosyltransferase
MTSEKRDRLACTRCGTDVDRMDRFCRKCGLALRAEAGAIEAYLAQILPGRGDAALKDRFKEQKSVEVETAELLAERAMKWLRAFGFF